ncbi:hypothetical protein FHR23_002308 [Stakelama sediminis]|uniref:Uncharacterized protein n=1 Tax=Stakelama sediminis TaxID=463200 RepID=A0A840Z0R0_9SPHN|nr:hypothetical protein [Stakelama sediminis]
MDEVIDMFNGKAGLTGRKWPKLEFAVRIS